MKKVFLSFALATTIASAAFAKDYPVTIENCGVKQTFDQPPKSAVTIGQAATEAMYLLGLADKVKGTAVWFTDVLPEYADANVKIERLADNTPSFEAVVNKRPGLVVSQYEWYVGPKGSVGTREQFHDLSVTPISGLQTALAKTTRLASTVRAKNSSRPTSYIVD